MGKIVALFSLIVPVVAIVGGISVAIVRLITQAKLEELARRERIAAIERGVDPAKLAPIAGPSHEVYSFGDSRLRRAHGLLIGGLILVAVGIGLSIFVGSVDPDKNHWVVGLVPLLIGVALLVGCRIVWPRSS